MVFSVWSVLRDVISTAVIASQSSIHSWSNELVLRQSTAGENVSSTEAEDIVGIRHQVMTGKDTAGPEDLVCPIVICEV
jgi:hypothetical protein